jgi:perosamine synthetase
MKRSVTRRTFIQGTGAALAGIAVAPRMGLSAADLVGKPNKLALQGGTPVRGQPYPSTWPIIDKAEEDALLAALRSRNWCCLRGHCVYDLEKTFAAAMGAKRAVFSNGGTTALGASLQCLGIGAGDEVITTPNTFIATINVITNLHALPVYVDIDPDTGSINADLVDAAINENTRAILPVHLAGFPVDIRKIMAVADKHKIPVVEDACQSVFAEVDGKKVGTFGATGCISFQEWKSLVSGEGGAVLSNDDELGRRCASFVNNGRDAKGEIGGYPFPGSNHRMTEFQAAVLTAQYAKFLRHDAQRQKNGRVLEEALAKIPGLSLRKRYNPNTRFTYVQFEINYDPKAFKDVPAATFAKALQAEGIPFDGGPRIYRGGCHKEGMLEEHISSRGFVKAFGKARLDTYRESIRNLPVMDGKEPAKRQFLSMDSKIPLLGPEKDIEDIVTAFQKVAANLDSLHSA